LGKFLKDFSGDQIVAWGLFGIDFTFDNIFNLVNPDFSSSIGSSGVGNLVHS